MIHPPELGGHRAHPVRSLPCDRRPPLPLAPPADTAPARDSERMAAEIEAFVIALNADLISADDFAG